MPEARSGEAETALEGFDLPEAEIMSEGFGSLEARSGEAKITSKPWEVSVDTLSTTFGWVPLTLVPDNFKFILCSLGKLLET